MDVVVDVVGEHRHLLRLHIQREAPSKEQPYGWPRPDIGRRHLLGAGLVLPFAGGFAHAAEPWSQVGPYEVATVEQMDIVDAVGGRKIPTRAYIPAKPGRYPGIIFSHGFGGSLKTFPNTGNIWASHGYVVLHPTHLDSLGFPDPKVEPADAEVMRKFRENRAALDPATREAFVHVLDHPYFIASRLDDVTCLLQLLKSGGSGMDETVRGKTDTSRMGMSGHSFGGYTTLVCAGASLSPPPGPPVPEGFSGFLMMSGQGPGRMGLSDGSFAGLTRPFMATTGPATSGRPTRRPPGVSGPMTSARRETNTPWWSTASATRTSIHRLATRRWAPAVRRCGGRTSISGTRS